MSDLLAPAASADTPPGDHQENRMARLRHLYDDEGNYAGTSVSQGEQAYLEIRDRYQSRLGRVGMRMVRFPLRGVGPGLLWLVGLLLPLLFLVYVRTTLTVVVLVVFVLAAFVSEAAKNQQREPGGQATTWRASDAELNGPPDTLAALPAGAGDSDRTTVRRLSNLHSRRSGIRIAIVAFVVLALAAGALVLTSSVGGQLKSITHQGGGTPQTLDAGAGVDGGFPTTQDTTSSSPTSPLPANSPLLNGHTAAKAAAHLIADRLLTQTKARFGASPTLAQVVQAGDDSTDTIVQSTNLGPLVFGVNFQDGQPAPDSTPSPFPYPRLIASSVGGDACVEFTQDPASGAVGVADVSCSPSS
jgi:hypothetical protein